MKKMFILSFLIPFSLMGCSNNSNKISIMRNNDNEITLISTTALDNRIKNDIPTLVLLGSLTCSTCLNIKTYLSQYKNEFNLDIKYLDVSLYDDYSFLINKYPNMFNDKFPQLKLIENSGKYSEISCENVTNYNILKSRINSCISNSNINSPYKIETFNNDISSLNSYFIFSLDKDNNESFDIYKNELKNKFNETKNNTFFLTSDCSNEIILNLKTTYQLKSNNFALYIKENNVNISYYLEDINSLRLLRDIYL